MSPSPTELQLERLCGPSFLRLWSHARPHFAKGEELCDLLAVFGDDVFIFSDKARHIPETEASDPDSWRRWRRKVIDGSIDAVFKAQRRLKKSTQVFTDSAANVELPVRLPAYEKARIYRIAVVHGAASARRAIRGGSGSLPLSTISHDSDDAYCVHGLNTPDGFVHVIDEVALPIVLAALDTVPEFRDYLLFKEEVVAAGKGLSYVSEQDLLGAYLQRPHHADPWRHGLGELGNVSHVVLGGPAWSTFVASSAWRERMEANRVSYLWDGLIERVTAHVLSRRSGTTPDASLCAIEAALRICAAEPRTARRTLGQALSRLATHRPLDFLTSRVHVEPTGTAYTFLVMDGPTDADPAGVDHARNAYLRALMYMSREAIPAAAAHIGYAFTSQHAKRHTVSLLQLGHDPFDEEWRSKVDVLLRCFPPVFVQEQHFTENEYPGSP